MANTRARFIEPMLLLRTERVPEGPDWLTELKLDGYRALAIKTGGKVSLRSRNDNDFTSRYRCVGGRARTDAGRNRYRRGGSGT